MRPEEAMLLTLDPVSRQLWLTTNEVVAQLQQDVATLADVVKQLAQSVFDLEDAVFPNACEGGSGDE